MNALGLILLRNTRYFHGKDHKAQCKNRYIVNTGMTEAFSSLLLQKVPSLRYKHWKLAAGSREMLDHSSAIVSAIGSLGCGHDVYIFSP